MRGRRVEQVLRVGINRAVMLGVVMGLCGMGLKVSAQQHNPHPGSPPPTATNQPVTPPNTTQPGLLPALDSPEAGVGDPAIRSHMEAERLKAANDDRHKRLVLDIDKLISLTNELKTDVDKTNKDELSLDVVRKAQEIEKLAHDVQSRMRN